MNNFITEFLKIGNFSSRQKDKMIELIAKGLFEKKSITTRKRHNPKDTHNFLLLFSNSNYIKYLTHRFEGENPEYSDFIENCKKEFEEAKEKYPNIPNKIIDIIYEFAFEKEQKIYINKGWSTPEFKMWYENSNIHPVDDENLEKEMIKPFKESIEVRAGNLTSIIESIKEKYSLFKFHFKKEELNQAEFYTNVDDLYLSLQRIMGMIKDASAKNLYFEIEVKYAKVGGMHQISIIHKDSKCDKKSDYTFEMKGDFDSLKKRLWGIANLEIEAEFQDGFFRKTILTDIQNNFNKIESIDKVDGFTYNLKFY